MPGVKEGRQALRTLTRRCAPTSPLGAHLGQGYPNAAPDGVTYPLGAANWLE